MAIEADARGQHRLIVTGATYPGRHESEEIFVASKPDKCE
jgi:hypothetical protein